MPVGCPTDAPRIAPGRRKATVAPSRTQVHSRSLTVIGCDTRVAFADLLRGVPIDGGLSQADVASRSSVARPNVAAFEGGRREPRWDTAVRMRCRPRLWRLPIERAVRTITPGVALWWSGPHRSFDLAVRTQRMRAYEVVLREGGPEDIGSVVDGSLLMDAWAELAVPLVSGRWHRARSVG